MSITIVRVFLLPLLLSIAAAQQLQRQSANSGNVQALGQQCRHEAHNCHVFAAFGYCQGSRYNHLFDALWRQCSCSCNAIAAVRRRRCCAGVGVPQSCQQVCSSELSVADYISPAVSKCNRYMPHHMYCMSEGIDASSCCSSYNVPSSCRPLCSGDSSVVCLNLSQMASSYFQCAGHMTTIKTCYKRMNQFNRPTWQSNWRPPC